MKIKPFELERYFARYEFSTKYLLSSSDCDGWSMKELLSLADEESRKLWDGLRLGYTESQGLPILRQEIAKLYSKVSPDDVLTIVPEEGILIALSALLEHGDHVVCTWPGYQSLYQIAESIGCQVSKWEPDKAGWKFDVDKLATLLRPGTKMLVVNFPHNPTGALPSVVDFKRIAELAAKRGILLFSDEMYRWLEHDPKDRLPSACELPGKSIALSGMSKTFGLAGLRLGWLVTKDKELYRRFAEYKDYTTICGSAPSEILSLIALRAKDKIVDRHLKRIARNLKLLDGFFSRHPKKFSWNRPGAGTIGFPGYLGPGDVADFCKQAVEKAGILLLPSTVYDYPKPHFRVGFGRENMPEALERFENFLVR